MFVLKELIFSKREKEGQMNESLQSWMKNAGSIMYQVAQRHTLEQLWVWVHVSGPYGGEGRVAVS